MSDIIEKFKAFKAAYLRYDALKATLKAEQERFDRETADLRAKVQTAQDALDTVDSELRQLNLRHFEEYGEPVDPMGVRHLKGIDGDPDAIIEAIVAMPHSTHFAELKKCLKVDTKALDAFVRQYTTFTDDGAVWTEGEGDFAQVLALPVIDAPTVTSVISPAKIIALVDREEARRG